MRAFVRLLAPDGSRYELVHGDLIGRLRTAAMSLDDARVSEAHAMVSLREQELRLIALRGGLALDGRPVPEVALAAGMEIVLARGLRIEVEEVILPEWVLGIEGDALARQIIPSVCSVLTSPRLRLASGYAEDALAWLWSTGGQWRMRRMGDAPRAIRPGDVLEVGSQRLHLVQIPLSAASQAPTRLHGGVDAPLSILNLYDTVHLRRESAVVAVLAGIPARMISELADLGGPVHWTVLTGLLWPREADAEVARSRLDVNLSRLRRKLREVRVRTDLVHTDGAGNIELLLYPQDSVEGRS